MSAARSAQLDSPESNPGGIDRYFDPCAVDEPLTDRFLTNNERQLRTDLRSVLREEVAPRARYFDRTETFAGESYQAIARAGLAGLVFPREYGGLETSMLAYAMAVEEIAAVCGSTSAIYMTQVHAAYPILSAGTAEQKQCYLPRLCDGSAYGSIAITEPDAGSDMASMRTFARRDGGDYVIDGGKIFITTGDRADVIACFATVDREAGRNGITGFLLEGDAVGLHRGRVLSKLGMHGSSTAELFFDGVRVPVSARLGDEGQGWEMLIPTMIKSRISAAAQGAGLARAAYIAGLSWASDTGRLRGRGGGDIEFRLSALRARVLAARLLLYSVVRDFDAAPGRDFAADIAMSKLTCTDLATAAAIEVIDLLGPSGDLASAKVERVLRDAKATQIYDGTSQIQQLIIARDTARRIKDEP